MQDGTKRETDGVPHTDMNNKNDRETDMKRNNEKMTQRDQIQM